MQIADGQFAESRPGFPGGVTQRKGEAAQESGGCIGFAQEVVFTERGFASRGGLTEVASAVHDTAQGPGVAGAEVREAAGSVQPEVFHQEGAEHPVPAQQSGRFQRFPQLVLFVSAFCGVQGAGHVAELFKADAGSDGVFADVGALQQEFAADGSRDRQLFRREVQVVIGRVQFHGDSVPLEDGASVGLRLRFRDQASGFFEIRSRQVEVDVAATAEFRFFVVPGRQASFLNQRPESRFPEKRQKPGFDDGQRLVAPFGGIGIGHHAHAQFGGRQLRLGQMRRTAQQQAAYGLFAGGLPQRGPLRGIGCTCKDGVALPQPGPEEGHESWPKRFFHALKIRIFRGNRYLCTTMRCKEEYRLQELGDDHWLIGPSAEGGRRAVRLNDSAAFLWRSVAGKEFSEADLVRLLQAEYGPDATAADARSIAAAWLAADLAE